MKPIQRVDNAAKYPLRVISLLACTVTVAMIWCLVLPRLGKFEPVRAHIEAMEKGDINVGAMFYSELNWEPPTGAAWR